MIDENLSCKEIKIFAMSKDEPSLRICSKRIFFKRFS